MNTRMNERDHSGENDGYNLLLTSLEKILSNFDGDTAELEDQDDDVSNMLDTCVEVLKRAGQHENAKELQRRVTSCELPDEAVSIMLEYLCEGWNTLMKQRKDMGINERDHSDENNVTNLFPPSLAKILPNLHNDENLRELKLRGDHTVYARFFEPDTDWEFFVLKGVRIMQHSLCSNVEDFEDFLFFGVAHRCGNEFYCHQCSLSELEVIYPLNPFHHTKRVERDLSFKPKPLSDVLPEHSKTGGKTDDEPND